MASVRRSNREESSAPPLRAPVPRPLEAASWPPGPSVTGSASLTVDTDGIVLTVDPATTTTVGRDGAELEGQGILELVSPADRRTVSELLDTARQRAGTPTQRCFRLLSASGAERWVECAARSIPGPDRRPVALLFLHDLAGVTEEGARHLEHQARLRALTLEVSMAQERERRRIASGLHDGVGQSLALARMKLGAFRVGADPERAREIREVEGLIEEAIRAMRELTFDLSSPLLYELGLDEAIISEGERLVDGQGVQFAYRSEGGPPPTANDPIVLLHRAVRELLLNAVKHARATRIDVVLDARPDGIEILVADDGVGCDVSEGDPDHLPPTGLGLLSQREQLRAIGGELTVVSVPGRGTRCLLSAPRSVRDA